MSHFYRKFIPALIYSVPGIAVTFVIVRNAITLGRPIGTPDEIAGAVDAAIVEIPFLINFIFPIMILVYLVSLFPVSILFVLGNKMVKGPTNTQSIIEIGVDFSAFHIFGRAIVPALFAVSTSQLIWGFIRYVLFQGTELGVSYLNLFVIVSTISTLFFLPISLAYFAPTWLLNDAGIVSHLKLSQMETRRCPDTVGVGRWYSNLLGGYSLVVTLAMTVYNTIGLPGLSIFRSIALPLLAIAFILPFVVLHEILVPKTVPFMQRIVARLGVTRSHSLEDLMLESMTELHQ